MQEEDVRKTRRKMCATGEPHLLGMQMYQRRHHSVTCLKAMPKSHHSQRLTLLQLLLLQNHLKGGVVARKKGRKGGKLILLFSVSRLQATVSWWGRYNMRMICNFFFVPSVIDPWLSICIILLKSKYEKFDITFINLNFQILTLLMAKLI